MPGSYRIDPDRRLLHYRYGGIVTVDDMLEVARAAVTDPRFEVGFRVLIDVSDITGHEIGSDTVRALVSSVSKPLDRVGRSWQVAVAAPSDVAFGFARMYELLRSGSPEEVHVFRTLAAACAFLGLDEADLA